MDDFKFGKQLASSQTACNVGEDLKDRIGNILVNKVAGKSANHTDECFRPQCFCHCILVFLEGHSHPNLFEHADIFENDVQVGADQ